MQFCCPPVLFWKLLSSAMMSRLPSLLPCFLLLVCLLQPSAVEGKVDCYVCSWASTDLRDSCTNAHFNTSVRIHNCQYGCESVTVYDKNDKLDNFYRNCASPSNLVGCRTDNTKSMKKEVCTCFTDYCNSSSQLQVFTGLVLFAFALVFQNGNN